MGQFAALATDGKINQPIRDLLARMLEQELVSGVLVPARQPFQDQVMQTLISDPAALEAIDPLAPVVPVSSAKLASTLTRRSGGRAVAVLMRSCEVRAFLELVKLHQGRTEDLVLIGVDCLGRYENRDYRALVQAGEQETLPLVERLLGGGGDGAAEASKLAAACQACTQPVAGEVDLRLCVIGGDPAQTLHLEAVSPRGEEIARALELETGDPPAGREAALEALIARRAAHREQHLAQFAQQTGDMAGLAQAVAPCVNCYNCRVACPVCYCKECVFVTDTMRHDGEQLLNWSHKRGKVKLPGDTVFYHMTRMLHMSALCVGCGQCSSACPNDVPVWELLSSVADRTQQRFGYQPGRSLADPQPLAVFYAEEFDDVTGQVK